MTRGGRRDGSGRPRTYWRGHIGEEACAALRLLAWRRYGRPATDEEEAETLALLIREAARAAEEQTK